MCRTVCGLVKLNCHGQNGHFDHFMFTGEERRGQECRRVRWKEKEMRGESKGKESKKDREERRDGKEKE